MRQTEQLTAERVLRTAVELADRHGIEWLSMRKLADELGVSAMSPYYYVPNKDRLIDGMVDIVFSEIEPPSLELDWKAAMRRRAVSTREALNRHRWAVGHMEGRTDHGAANLRLHDAVLGCLRAAGFSLEMTVHAYSVQDAYIYGFVLQETDMSSETPDDFAAEAQRQMQAYEEHGLHRVYAEADDRNVPVHRLLERLGFRCEARLVEADWFKGEWATLRVYAALRREWAR